MEKNKAGQEERHYWVCGWSYNTTSALPSYASKGWWRLGPQWQWQRWWNVVGIWVSFHKSWRRPQIGPCIYLEEENFGRAHWKCKGPEAGVSPDVQETVKKDQCGWNKARGKERGMPHVLGLGGVRSASGLVRFLYRFWLFLWVRSGLSRGETQFNRIILAAQLRRTYKVNGGSKTSYGAIAIT